MAITGTAPLNRRTERVRQNHTRCIRSAPDRTFHSGAGIRAKQLPRRAQLPIQARVPSDAFGLIGYPVGKSFGRSSNDVVSGVYFLSRDPDANIRFQLLRDFR